MLWVEPCRSRYASVVVPMRRCWREKHARVHDAGGVELCLRGAQRGGEELGRLTAVPRSVVAPDGVVMGDRAAKRQDRLGRSRLDRVPLLELLVGATGRVD